MVSSLFLLLLFFEFTSGYADGIIWKLAFNLNADDGHSFGFNTKAWDDDTDIGTDANAFNADYKSYSVTNEIANSIAIVRHQNGVCEAARVWEFLTAGNTLHDYLDSDKTSRLIVTYENYTYSYTSPTMANKDKDPIFAAEGALAFNWRTTDNGIRIGNSAVNCEGGMPDVYSKRFDYSGLGNVFGKNDKDWWFDLGVYNCKKKDPLVQGSDHGGRFKDGEIYGQYAIYVSDGVETFPCKDSDLQISILNPSSENGFLNWDQLLFDTADQNSDGLLSLHEYSETRSDYGKTATDAELAREFNWIEKDLDDMLSFDEILFDTVDLNKDGVLSLEEYTQARIKNIL